MPNWAYLAPFIAFALTLGAMAFAHLALAAELPPIPADMTPDLVPTTATVTPSPAYKGDVLQVSVTIENRGNATAMAATIQLIDARPNGDVVSIGSMRLQGPLVPDASVVVSTPPFVAAGVGPHTLTVGVDGVRPAEVNRENDALSIQISIQPTIVVPPPSPSSEESRVEAFQDLRNAAVLGIVIVALIVVITVLPPRPRVPEQWLPSPPEPPDRTPPPIWPP